MDAGPYGTGWIWNEQTGLWENSQVTKSPKPEPDKKDREETRTSTASTYHYSGDCAPKERIRERYHKTESSNEEDTKTEENSQTNSTYAYNYSGSHIPKEYIKTRDYGQQEKRQGSYQTTATTESAHTKEAPVNKPIPTENTMEYQDAYQAADVFTWNERNNYVTLKKAADKKGYIICPKMRLADIVKPRNDSQYMSRFGKIKSKHLDFVIYDNNMRHIITVIELDDNSHNRPDRQERDEFVDFILNDCGIRIIHTRHITENIFDRL